MVEVENLDGLIEALRPICESKPRPLLIGVDGGTGVGKTTFARQLAPRLGANTIHLDGFIEKGEDDVGFQNFINYEKLETDLLNDLAACEFIIVEGICLLAILERVAVRPAALESKLAASYPHPGILIYVRQVNGRRRWDEKELFAPGPGDDDPEETIRKRFPNSTHLRAFQLDLEIVRYHKAFTPYSRADVLFTRVERLE